MAPAKIKQEPQQHQNKADKNRIQRDQKTKLSLIQMLTKVDQNLYTKHKQGDCSLKEKI